MMLQVKKTVHGDDLWGYFLTLKINKQLQLDGVEDIFCGSNPQARHHVRIRIRIRNGLMEKQQTCTQHNTA